MPTFHDDLPLSLDIANGANQITIQKVGYTTDLFPSTARRDLDTDRPSGSSPLPCDGLGGQREWDGDLDH